MKQILQHSVLVLLLLCSSALGIAQQQELDIRLNKQQFAPGDTLRITANQPKKKGVLATLFLMAEHENGMTWQMRWPFLNGRCETALVLPDSMPGGYYRLRFTVMQNLFTVFGKVKSPDNVKYLQATLLTYKGDVYESETVVQPDGNFTYNNVLFERDATILFTLPGKDNSEALDVEIATVLDSVATPYSGKLLDIYVGNIKPEEKVPVKPWTDADSSRPAAQQLEAVTVFTKPGNRGDIFNKNYSTGLFRDMNERIISLLDNPNLQGWNSIFQIVRTHAVGISIVGAVNPVVRWRGQWVQFYVDEMRVPVETVD
ncbi:MAG: hypothetical protein EOO03_10720, partial [Chitinophagaceae bacterium]